MNFQKWKRWWFLGEQKAAASKHFEMFGCSDFYDDFHAKLPTEPLSIYLLLFAKKDAAEGITAVYYWVCFIIHLLITRHREYILLK